MLDKVDLAKHMIEKLIDSRFKVLRDLLWLNSLHSTNRLLVEIEFLIENVLQGRRHLRCESEYLLCLIHIIKLIIDPLVAVELSSLLVDSNDWFLIPWVNLVLLGVLRM
jgi:hypothetical protein